MCLLFLVVLFCAPLFLYGPIDNGDWHVHWFRLAGFAQSLSDGVWRPLWHADANAGYGPPTFLFYPPLIYYLAEVPLSLGASITQAWLGMYAVMMVVTVLGAYVLFRRWVGAAWAGGLALGFALSPPLALVLHQFHLLANTLALCLLPWFLLTLIYPFRRPVMRPLSVATMTATIIISHPLTAIQAGLIAAAIMAYRISTRDWLAVIGLAVGAFLGAFASLWYWWPVLELRSLVHWEFFLNPAWSWENNVLFARPDGQVGAFHATRLLFDSLAVFVVFAASWSVFRIRFLPSQQRSFAFALLGCVALVILIMSPWGLWIVEKLPFLGYLNFAWRWLGPLWLLMLMLWAISLGAAAPGRLMTVAVSIMICVGAGLAVVISGALILPTTIAGLSTHRVVEIATITAVEDEIWPTLEMRPKSFTDRLGTDLSRDPLPLVWLRRGRAKITDVERGQHWIRFRYHADQPAQVRLRHFSFPGWIATLEQDQRLSPLPIGVEVLSGAMLLDLPTGHGSVELRFAGPMTASKGR